MENMEPPASKLTTKQKVFLFFLLSAYCGISIFSTINVFFKFSDIDDEISNFCGQIKEKVLKEDYKECSDISTDFGVWSIIQGIAVIVLFVINLMIFLIAFISVTCGTNCTEKCCTIGKEIPQCAIECYECGTKCGKCITEAAFKNPVIIQFIISILCIITTPAMLSASKKGDSLYDHLIQKYDLSGIYGIDSKGFNTSLILVIVFFALILASTPIYWILSKCYFNKINLPDIKENAGNNAEVNIQNESCKDLANTNEPPSIMATNSEIKPNNFVIKGETNSNVKNEVNSNVNEVNN